MTAFTRCVMTSHQATVNTKRMVLSIGPAGVTKKLLERRVWIEQALQEVSTLDFHKLCIHFFTSLLQIPIERIVARRSLFRG